MQYFGYSDFVYTKNLDFEDIPVISKPLMHICNNSFKTGVFPSRMKIAKIKPIFKSDAKTDIRNDRPICLLPQLSKMFEKLFLTRLDNFINAKDIVNSSQYSFRKAMSNGINRGNLKCNG